MKEAFKIIYLFKKPYWDDNSRWAYILFSIITWIVTLSAISLIFN
jgi:hypothetical protein